MYWFFMPNVINWTPADLTNKNLWYKADDLTTITKDESNNVSQWDDKSSAANNAVQASGAYQPTYAINILNGKPGINFGSNKYMNMTQTNKRSVIIVVSNVPAGTGSGGCGALMGVYRGGGKDSRFGLSSEEIRFDGTFTPAGIGQYGLNTTTLNGSSLAVHSITLGTTKIVYMVRDAAMAMKGLGATLNGTTTYANFFNGYIHEAIAYDGLWTGAEVSNLLTYLQGEWI